VRNPWVIRLLIAGLLLTLLKTAPLLAWIGILFCLGYAAYRIRERLAVNKSFGQSLNPSNHQVNRGKPGPSGVRAPKIIPSSYDPASALYNYLNENVYGQPLAAEQVSTLVWNRLKAGLNEKPLGVFCFAGPPGVGKTHFAKILNRRLFEREDTLLHVDMVAYGNPYAIAGLLGSADQSQPGILTKFVSERPNSIVLLDEFDKAAPEIHKRFLTAFNDGFITELSQGMKVSTTQVIFILTMNAAADDLVNLLHEYKNDPDALTAAARHVLLRSGQMAPEVVDRIDAIVPFAPLVARDLGKVVYQELQILAQKMNVPIVDGGLDLQILVNVVSASLNRRQGVRDIKRSLEAQFIRGLQAAKEAGATSVMLRDENGKVIIDRC
jgi:ATP-dependent Clp protease ATP-binding subunit ClpA